MTEKAPERTSDILINVIKSEAVNSEIERVLAGQIINELQRLETENAALRTQLAAAREVRPLRWVNKNKKHGYPDQATDCLGGEWSRWFVDSVQYFKAPGDKYGRQGCADDEYERRILSALSEQEGK